MEDREIAFHLKTIRALLKGLGMAVTARCFDKSFELKPIRHEIEEGVAEGWEELSPMHGVKFARSLQCLADVWRAELKGMYFVQIDAGEAATLDPWYAPFSEAAAGSFPSAVADMEEATRCFALGRYQAAVFHALRIAEVPLRATFRALLPQTSPSGSLTWGKIKDMLVPLAGLEKKDPPSPEEELARAAILSIMALQHIRDKRYMHVDEPLPRASEAAALYEEIRRFVNQLADQIDETGHLKRGRLDA
jgi:hypothetical protein